MGRSLHLPLTPYPPYRSAKRASTSTSTLRNSTPAQKISRSCIGGAGKAMSLRGHRSRTSLTSILPIISNYQLQGQRKGLFMTGLIFLAELVFRLLSIAFLFIGPRYLAILLGSSIILLGG